MTDFERIITLLNLNEWEIVIDYSLSCAGCIDESELEISLNPEYGDRILTLIHECLHIIYPGWTESKVEKESRLIHKSMSVRDMGMLLEYLFS